MKFKDYYEILGVPKGADADVVKTAYRKLARKYHPDVSKESDAEERFKSVNEAYEVLKDPKKRAAYDELREGGYRPGEEFRPPPNFRQDYEFEGGDGEGFSDFFESLFGRRFGGGGPGGAGGAPRGPRRTRDTRARLPIELERAYEGGRERIQVDGKTLDVNIPRGIEPGRTIRLAGQGSGGGDLLLEIGYRPHARYTVEGRDLILRLPVAPWEAALGATIAVPTLGGSVDLRIPAGTGTGRKLRLKARGLPGETPGDQYVVIEVQAPKPEDDAQREAYEALRDAYPGYDPRRAT
ncbi:MAG TPA: DnaJ C-terminal domain-containing protein [Candidatus Saccharimonadia bacterium]|nr:DnaJ C-terminal domain-containing protein [Candidatus Saccharimonadia bacterium]